MIFQNAIALSLVLLVTLYSTSIKAQDQAGTIYSIPSGFIQCDVTIVSGADKVLVDELRIGLGASIRCNDVSNDSIKSRVKNLGPITRVVKRAFTANIDWKSILELPNVQHSVREFTLVEKYRPVNGFPNLPEVHTLRVYTSDADVETAKILESLPKIRHLTPLNAIDSDLALIAGKDGLSSLEVAKHFSSETHELLRISEDGPKVIGLTMDNLSQGDIDVLNRRDDIRIKLGVQFKNFRNLKNIVALRFLPSKYDEIARGLAKCRSKISIKDVCVFRQPQDVASLINSLSSLPSLEKLTLFGNYTKDELAGLSNLKKLKSLALISSPNNSNLDISSILKLSKLSHLRLENIELDPLNYHPINKIDTLDSLELINVSNPKVAIRALTSVAAVKHLALCADTSVQLLDQDFLADEISGVEHLKVLNDMFYEKLTTQETAQNLLKKFTKLKSFSCTMDFRDAADTVGAKKSTEQKKVPGQNKGGQEPKTKMTR